MGIEELIEIAKNYLPNPIEYDSHEVKIRIPDSEITITYFYNEGNKDEHVYQTPLPCLDVTFIKCAVSKSMIKAFPLGPFKNDFDKDSSVIKWIPELYLEQRIDPRSTFVYPVQLSKYLLKQDE